MGDEVGIPPVDDLVNWENVQDYRYVVLSPETSEAARMAALYYASLLAGTDPMLAAGIRARWER